MQTPDNLMLFLGQFHPMLVHLPIGGLVLLGMLEALAGSTRWKDAARSNRWILGFVSVGACVSAACGWVLAQGGGYDPQILKWHRAAGLGVSAGCLLCLLLRQREQLHAYRISLAATLLLLVAGSHLGGSLTHGSDFLSRYAPTSLRTWFGPLIASRVGIAPAEAATQQEVFARLIQPILQDRCAACHGAEKHKAGLRLDMLEGLLAGGRNGPVIRFGRAQDSSLIQRMMLPLDSDGRMPPEDAPQPTADEIALLEWWINATAAVTESVVERKPKAESRRLLETASKRPQSVK